jgi:hypothetical protein
MKLKKMSKSDSPPVYTKAQVFKAGGRWLHACQNGCPNKYVPEASHTLAFKIAESHMMKTHPEVALRSERITL